MPVGCSSSTLLASIDMANGLALDLSALLRVTTPMLLSLKKHPELSGAFCT